MNNHAIKSIGIFLLSVTVCIFLLFFSACFPQAAIDNNVRVSSEYLKEEGTYPKIADHSDAAQLDNWTEALILSQSKAMNIHSPESIFTNPLYEVSKVDPVEDLYILTHDEGVEPTGSYARYWMGFRVFIRPLLVFFNYFQIRRYLSLAFFLLLFASVCVIGKHTGWKSAFLFAGSIALVRPHIVSTSMQFSCCFLLGFLAILMVPYIYSKGKNRRYFFLEIGILTMFFDFYTTPIITFGFPATFLLLLEIKNQDETSLKKISADFLSWMAGYVGMWLVKLVLTSLLTDVNGIANGLGAFASRVGIVKASGLEEFYFNPISAIWYCWYALHSDRAGAIVMICTIGILLTALVFALIYRRPPLSQFKKNKELVFIAALPVLWFLAATQPISIHYWFQYRAVCLSFWSISEYILCVLCKAEARFAT